MRYKTAAPNARAPPRAVPLFFRRIVSRKTETSYRGIGSLVYFFLCGSVQTQSKVGGKHTKLSDFMQKTNFECPAIIRVFYENLYYELRRPDCRTDTVFGRHTCDNRFEANRTGKVQLQPVPVLSTPKTHG